MLDERGRERKTVRALSGERHGGASRAELDRAVDTAAGGEPERNARGQRVAAPVRVDDRSRRRHCGPAALLAGARAPRTPVRTRGLDHELRLAGIRGGVLGGIVAREDERVEWDPLAERAARARAGDEHARGTCRAQRRGVAGGEIDGVEALEVAEAELGIA